MRGAPGLGVQAADGLAGDAVPVAVELRGPLVEEDEPGQVGRPSRVTGGRRVEHGRVQRVAQLVGGQDVQPSVPGEGRGVGHRVQQPLHARPDLLPGGLVPSGRGGVGYPYQVEQVCALDLVQLQGAGDAVEHLVGDAADVAAFQPCVVLDRDARQLGCLVPAQPGHPPPSAVTGQPGLLRGDLGAPGGQELADLAADVLHAGHVSEVRQACLR